MDCFSFVSANYHKPPCTYYDMVIKHMQKTKIIIALVAIAALTLVAVGLASAQIAANQTYTSTNPDQNTGASNGGFFGWIGSCFGIRTNQPYNYQYTAPPAATDNSTPAPSDTSTQTPAPYEPYQPYQPYQGYGYGPCMGGW